MPTIRQEPTARWCCFGAGLKREIQIVNDSMHTVIFALKKPRSVSMQNRSFLIGSLDGGQYEVYPISGDKGSVSVGYQGDDDMLHVLCTSLVINKGHTLCITN